MEELRPREPGNLLKAIQLLVGLGLKPEALVTGPMPCSVLMMDRNAGLPELGAPQRCGGMLSSFPLEVPSWSCYTSVGPGLSLP